MNILVQHSLISDLELGLFVQNVECLVYLFQSSHEFHILSFYCTWQGEIKYTRQYHALIFYDYARECESMRQLGCICACKNVFIEMIIHVCVSSQESVSGCE